MKGRNNNDMKIKTNMVQMPVGLFIAHSIVMMMLGDLLCKDRVIKIVEELKMKLKGDENGQQDFGDDEE